MTCRRPRLVLLPAVFAAVAAAGCGRSPESRPASEPRPTPDPLLALPATGPSTSTPPYLVPSSAVPAGAVRILSILTAGDRVGGYRMVGVPDGLGVLADAEGTFSLLMNHELLRAEGTTRAHGERGAFVSRWTIHRKTLQVLAGGDHTEKAAQVHVWDRSQGTWVAGPFAFDRFCAATLAPVSAFFHRGHGTPQRLFLNGEEGQIGTAPDFGGAFAHVATGSGRGEVWELPHLGRMAFENVVPSPHPQMKTVVILVDDVGAVTRTTGVPSEIYAYVGSKKETGRDVERAGLTGGSLYGVQVIFEGSAAVEENDAFGWGEGPAVARLARFALVALGDVSSWTGHRLQDASIAAKVTRFRRLEDGVWDPRPGQRNDFYCATTASIDSRSRLWRLRFDDIANPERGGVLEMLLTGDEGHRALDNLDMDRHGRLLLQEDAGADPRLSKVWLYDTRSGRLWALAEHDPAVFSTGGARFLTENEEASGITDAEDALGRGWFLLDVQAHYPADVELVSGGQLLALWLDPSFAP